MKKMSILSYLACCVGAGAVMLGATGALILHAGREKQDPDCDFIIVLGSKLAKGAPTATLNERIGRALGYLKDHPKTLAILSGGNGEAQAMFDALTAAGISENRLILEGKSTSTWQNLKYSLPMAEDKTVGIVSSDYHLFRAKLYIKEDKIALIGAKTKDFPRWAHNFCREIAGVWHYFILGGTYE